jgi:hypothetical protein
MSILDHLAAFVAGAKNKIVWGYLFAVWLWGVILNLSLFPGTYDFAQRELGLTLAVLALAVLALACLGNRSWNPVLSAAYAVAKRRSLCIAFTTAGSEQGKAEDTG